MRKAYGIAGIAVCWILTCMAAQADTTRDGKDNQGTAQQHAVHERDQTPEPSPEPESAGESTEVSIDQADPAPTDSAAVCTCNEACGNCHSESCGECNDGKAYSSCNSCGGLEFFGPMGIINMHPTNAIFLTPVPERALLIGDGQRSFSFKMDMANLMIRELDSGIIASFDFEEYQFSAEYHEGTADGEFMVNIPLRYRSSGTFDGIITDWHKFFGLPRGLRDDYPNNLYQFTIVSRDGTVFNDEGDSFGLGDIRIGYKHSLNEADDGSEALALRGIVKLPTGDSASALGSGGLDFSIGALYQRQLSRRMRAYLNADYIFIGEPDWDNIEHSDAHSYSAALEYALTGSTTFVTQLSVQNNPLRIGSFEADKDSQEIKLGVHSRLSEDLFLTVGFSEDANPETAPDFGLNTYLTWEF